MRRSTIILVFVLGLPQVTLAQKPNVSIPDPLRFYNKYDVVWSAVRETLTAMDFDIESEDRAGGKLKTRSRSFSSGTLTPSDIVKYCNPPDLTDGNWVKARYSVEVTIERLGTNENLFRATPTIEGSKRDFKGTEQWVRCPSIGRLERKIYSEVGRKLLGSTFAPTQKKGFWDKKPQPVPGRKIEVKPLPDPSRPPSL